MSLLTLQSGGAGVPADTGNHILAENSSILSAENGDHLITET